MVKKHLYQFKEEEIDQMIALKWHRHVENPHYPAYVSNAVIGKVFGIDGSSVRRLYM